MLSPLVPPEVVPCSEAALESEGDSKLVLLDCRFDLGEPSAGRRAHLAGHIPGASHADLEQDLSGQVIPGKTGRHPLPPIDVFVERLRAFGVEDDSRVVVYDESSGAIAARLWWMLRWLGHEQVFVLDGGYRAWLAQGGEPSVAVPRPRRGNFEARPRPELLVSADDILRRGSELLLIDARNPERFRGEVEPIDPVAGHIPGAICVPFVENVDETGRFRPREVLAERFAKQLAGTAPERVVAYCGSGVTACHDLLAAAHAGIGELRLYAGSFSEWITEPSRPVATGDGRK